MNTVGLGYNIAHKAQNTFAANDNHTVATVITEHTNIGSSSKSAIASLTRRRLVQPKRARHLPRKAFSRLRYFVAHCKHVREFLIKNKLCKRLAKADVQSVSCS
jgi:hypothetical protein